MGLSSFSNLLPAIFSLHKRVWVLLPVPLSPKKEPLSPYKQYNCHARQPYLSVPSSGHTPSIRQTLQDGENNYHINRYLSRFHPSSGDKATVLPAEPVPTKSYPHSHRKYRLHLHIRTHRTSLKSRKIPTVSLPNSKIRQPSTLIYIFCRNQIRFKQKA